MLRIMILCLGICLATTACHVEVGDFPKERIALHEKNATDCNKTPHSCHNGIPW